MTLYPFDVLWFSCSTIYDSVWGQAIIEFPCLTWTIWDENILGLGQELHPGEDDTIRYAAYWSALSSTCSDPAAPLNSKESFHSPVQRSPDRLFKPKTLEIFISAHRWSTIWIGPALVSLHPSLPFFVYVQNVDISTRVNAPQDALGDFIIRLFLIKWSLLFVKPFWVWHLAGEACVQFRTAGCGNVSWERLTFD